MEFFNDISSESCEDENNEVFIDEGFFTNRFNPIEMFNEVQFKKCYLLSKESNRVLINEVCDDLKHSTKRGQSLEPEDQVRI